MVRNVTGNYLFKTLCPLTKREKDIVLAGGALNHSNPGTGK